MILLLNAKRLSKSPDWTISSGADNLNALSCTNACQSRIKTNKGNAILTSTIPF
ncbi:MAG: hypothetical protein ACJAUW_000287 [Yoonia sp.]